MKKIIWDRTWKGHGWIKGIGWVTLPGRVRWVWSWRGSYKREKSPAGQFEIRRSWHLYCLLLLSDMSSLLRKSFWNSVEATLTSTKNAEDMTLDRPCIKKDHALHCVTNLKIWLCGQSAWLCTSTHISRFAFAFEEDVPAIRRHKFLGTNTDVVLGFIKE